MVTSSKQYNAIGEDPVEGPYKKLFAMTYGALIVQLIQDYEDYAEVNKQLEKMGHKIGTHLIEDFLARSNLGRLADFKETGEVIAKVSFKSFLNVAPAVTHSQESQPLAPSPGRAPPQVAKDINRSDTR